MKLLAAILLILFSGAVWAADDDAWEWIGKMRQSISSLNYHGTLVYLRDGRMESMRVIHKNSDGKEIERVIQLTGTPREVLREGDRVTCFLPDSKSVVVGQRRFGDNLLAKLGGQVTVLSQMYRVTVEGDERVAGLQARILRVKPADEFRYGYRLWIATESGLLLKSVLLDDRDEPVEQLMFVELSIVDTIPIKMLKPGLDTRDFTWYHEDHGDAPAHVKGPRWDTLNLPAGFAVQDYYQHPMPGNTHPTEHLLIGDGLGSVSVYIEQAADAEHSLRGATKLGAVHMYGVEAGAYHVTVIGEAPAVTIKRVADAVALRVVNE